MTELFTKWITTELGVIEWISIVLIVAALIISVIAIFKRLPAQSTWYRGSLIFLNLVAFLAILALILQPQYKTDKNFVISLFTDANIDNTNRDFVSAKNHFYLVTNQLNEANIRQSEPSYLYQDKTLQTPEQLLLKYPSLNELKIIGDGLTDWQWRNFPEIKIDYQVPTLIEGIVNPNWKSNISLGESLVFNGRLQSVSANIYRARLLNPAGEIVAEKNLLAGEIFELTAKPKLTGQHLYTLEILDHQQIPVSQQILSVNVSANGPARILVVQSSPSFETKQLQNWAAENGAQLLLRTRISQGIDSSRSTNIAKPQMKKIKLLGLSQTLFDQFDLVIIDGRRLLMMSKREKTELRLSIKNGLGLLVLADQNLLATTKKEIPELLNGFQLMALNRPTEIIPYIVSEELSRTALSDNFIPLVAQSISSSEKTGSLQSLVQSSQGHILVAQKNTSLGKVAISLLQQTYRLVTSGQQVYYSQLWQHLIKQIARKDQQSMIYINSNQPFSFEKQRLEICYRRSSSEAQPVTSLQLASRSGVADSQSLLLQTDPLLKDRSCGYFWSKTSGWYTISSELPVDNPRKFTDLDFYVVSKTSWLAHQQHHKIQATKAKQADFTRKTIQAAHWQKTDEWIFWWMLVISASLLWAERKFLSQEATHFFGNASG